MNWLLIVVLALVLLGMLIGAVRGALRIVVSLVVTVVTLVAVVFLTPYVSETIIALTPMEEVLEAQCLDAISKAMGNKAGARKLTEEQIRSMMRGAGVTEEELANQGITIEKIINGEVKGSDLEKLGISPDILDGHTDQVDNTTIYSTEIPRQMQIEAIEKSNLPEVFKELLLSNNNREVYQKLGANTFAEYVGKYFSRLVINIFSFFITFIIITIVMRAIIFALDIVTSLPGLGLINRMLGMALGAGIALVVVEFLFVVITMLYTTGFGSSMMEMVKESELLTFIYDNNVVMQLMTSLR